MGARTNDTTGFQRASLADALFETNYEPNLAAELWLNLDGKEYRLIGKNVRIGRALDNDIALEDRSCSRYHAVITIYENKIILEDLKSRNGVVVNGQKIDSKHVLEDNDEIEIGDLKGIFFKREKNKKKKEAPSKQKDSKIAFFSSIPAKLKNFKELPKPLKLGAVAMAPLILFGFLIGLGGSAPSQKAQTTSSATSTEFEFTKADIINAPLDRAAFDQCIELEDLGIYQDAKNCLQALPLTTEVYAALKRVSLTQKEFAQRRYEEGLSAFNNYYYDLAILKFQEVLLIANADSEVARKARDLLNTAKRSRR